VPPPGARRSPRRHRPRAPGPLDETLADDPLEHRDLLADGRLGVAERRSRLAERALARDRLESQEMPQFDA
jgi:hypothetical protein